MSTTFFLVFIVWKVVKGAKKWLFPSVVKDNPSWPSIHQNELKNYRLSLREVVVKDNGNGERGIAFKSDNVDGRVAGEYQ